MDSRSGNGLRIKLSKVWKESIKIEDLQLLTVVLVWWEKFSVYQETTRKNSRKLPGRKIMAFDKAKEQRGSFVKSAFVGGKASCPFI